MQNCILYLLHFQCNSLHVHNFELQIFSNANYDSNDDNGNNTKMTATKSAAAAATTAAKYLVVDIRL